MSNPQDASSPRGAPRWVAPAGSGTHFREPLMSAPAASSRTFSSRRSIKSPVPLKIPMPFYGDYHDGMYFREMAEEHAKKSEPFDGAGHLYVSPHFVRSLSVPSEKKKKIKKPLFSVEEGNDDDL